MNHRYFCKQLKEKSGELQEKLRELYKIRDKIKEAKTLKEVEGISERIKKEIEEKTEKETAEINKLISSFLSNIYKEKGGKPFLQIFSRLAKEDLIDSYRIYYQPDGTLAGQVYFEEKNDKGNIIARYVPFQGNTLFKEIDGEKIINALDVHTQPNGTLAGSVKFQEKDDKGNIVKRWAPFKGNSLLKTIEGEKIIGVAGIYTLSGTNTLKGRINIESGESFNFEWGEDGAKIVE
jgi:hypothetical protein